MFEVTEEGMILGCIACGNFHVINPIYLLEIINSLTKLMGAICKVVSHEDGTFLMLKKKTTQQFLLLHFISHKMRKKLTLVIFEFFSLF